MFSDPSSDVFSPLFPEERIVFGLHPASFFETTLSHFKKLYNKNDAKLIAKQVFIYLFSIKTKKRKFFSLA